jgi:hypothetical protein
MNENRFVAVGRIERLIPTARGLKLVIGGPGPVRGLVAVELRDAALVALVSTPKTGFAAGDIVSVSGQLEFDVDTLQNVAIAAPDSISRIARGGPRHMEVPRPQPAPAASPGLFGVCQKPADSLVALAAHMPPLPGDFTAHTPLDAQPIGLSDIAL